MSSSPIPSLGDDFPNPRRFSGDAHESTNQAMNLKALLSTIKPIPFSPAKTLDFATHETLLRRLGLWRFVNLELESTVRVDLVAQLIANFDPNQGASRVDGVRVSVTRADMARALRLPDTGEKGKGKDNAGVEPSESIAFVEDLVLNWMVLHGDVWVMPEEVVRVVNVVREGCLGNVEWDGLVWFMVERELMGAPRLEGCYYASHLQCLIRSQCEGLFEEEVDVKMVDADCGSEECEIGLSLGGSDNAEQGERDGGDECGDGNVEEDEECGDEYECGDGNVEKYEDGYECGDGNVEEDDSDEECEDEYDYGDSEDDMGSEECEETEPEEDETMHWFLGKRNNEGENCLQSCGLGEIKESGFEERKQEGIEEEEEEEEDQQDDGFHISPNVMVSDNLIQAVDATQNPFSSGLQLHHHSPAHFLSSRGESHMISDSPSPLGNVRKREYGNENGTSHSLGGLSGAANKRLRRGESFDNKSDYFYSCMDQVQHLMGKARLMYDRKEHGFAESSMNQQVLLNELQQRDNTIRNIHNQRLAEQHKSDAHTYQLKRELVMMGDLLQNYRMALKETQRTFAEYRSRFPQPDEPLYKDVPGSGGLVLSTTELEKQHLKQLEEIGLNQMAIEKMFNEFAAGWTTTFNGHLDAVHLLESKLLGIDKEVEFLKGRSLKYKVSTLPESPECTPIEC